MTFIKHMGTIRKATSSDRIPGYDKAYWHAKTPQERLDAALKLIQQAKAIYRANPANPPLVDGNRVFKFRSADERRKR